MEVLRLFLLVVAVITTLPVAVYCLEILAGCWPRRKRGEEVAAERPRLAVLVPAHNEASGIAATLTSIQPQLRPYDRLVVIADNCTDATATVAQQQGATVLERHDEYRRGKGFALAFGLDRLGDDPPEVVVFLDADCRLEEHVLNRLTNAAQETQRPVQGLYLCNATVEQNAKQVLSALAFRFRNLIRMSGLNRLGGPCHLTGSGMALPWALVDKVAWATGNVVEDMQLGIDFTLAGYPPVFAPDAIVTSDLPSSDSALQTQRRRWEHGFLATALSQVPPLATQAVERRSWSLALLALDMMVPPLALLSLGLVAGWGLATLVWLTGLTAGPVVVMSVACLAFAVATLFGWAVHCRQVVPLSIFLSVPRYVLGKLPLYAQFVTRREQAWVRTERT